MTTKYVAYYCVSAAKPGRSGSGLEAQRKGVEGYLTGMSGILVGEFTEIESGRRNDRRELARALAACDLTGAILVVAKLHRLSRNVAFLAVLRDSGAPFVAADMPEANELTIHIMATVAEEERRAISYRTKEALTAAKARGVQLGGVRGNISDWKRGAVASAAVRGEAAADRNANVRRQIAALAGSEKLSLRQIADRLNTAGVRTARGGLWSATQVRRAMDESRGSEIVITESTSNDRCPRPRLTKSSAGSSRIRGLRRRPISMRRARRRR
ncbi:recombinase family protein [Sphingomonas oligophenolica]|uniref:Resolvase n=1 Tax=Sphingomonas oligophenolica TaxID=301154 RepID=A0A502CGF8_9SPHN|nr:recombinase family protein [Sphingomonas oligophenolica]TPG10831.1 resolvase [Sphingomonas oligophenolica]